jgi:hypothetical protein
MEHLVINLKEKLIARRHKESSNLEKLDKENDKELILFSAGRISELDFVVNSLDELLNYSEKMKMIEK